MPISPQLVLFSDNAQLLEAVSERFLGSPGVRVSLGTGPEITRHFHLDALWLTWMQASYFGAPLPPPVHRGLVFPMSTERRAQGMPRLGIAGAATTPADPVTPSFLATLRLRALLGAVRFYNDSHEENPIERIGSVPENLGLDDLSATEAFRLVKLAFAPQTELEVQALPPERLRA